MKPIDHRMNKSYPIHIGEVVLLLVALTLRCYPLIPLSTIPLSGDMVHYNHAALLLVERHVLTYWSDAPSAQVTPGYPLFLALCYWLAHTLPSATLETDLHVATFAQAALSAITVWLVYRISRCLMPVWASYLVAVLWLIYPPAEGSVKLILTETLYLCALLFFTWCFLRALERPTWLRWSVAGLTLAITVLVRPVPFPFVCAPLFLLLAKTRRGERLRTSLIGYGAYVLTFGIAMLPWWIRNVLTFHRLILTSDDDANPLLYGAVPNFGSQPNLSKGLSPAQQYSLAIHLIRYGFAHEPLRYLKWYTIDKLNLLFSTPWYISTTTHDPVAELAHLQLVWVILGGVGTIAMIKHPQGRWLTGFALSLTVLQLPFIPINRYVFPVMPFLFIGIGYLLAQIVPLLRPKSRHTSAA